MCWSTGCLILPSSCSARNQSGFRHSGSLGWLLPGRCYRRHPGSSSRWLRPQSTAISHLFAYSWILSMKIINITFIHQIYLLWVCVHGKWDRGWLSWSFLVQFIWFFSNGCDKQLLHDKLIFQTVCYLFPLIVSLHCGLRCYSWVWDLQADYNSWEVVVEWMLWMQLRVSFVGRLQGNCG